MDEVEEPKDVKIIYLVDNVLVFYIFHTRLFWCLVVLGLMAHSRCSSEELHQVAVSSLISHSLTLCLMSPRSASHIYSCKLLLLLERINTISVCHEDCFVFVPWEKSVSHHGRCNIFILFNVPITSLWHLPSVNSHLFVQLEWLYHHPSLTKGLEEVQRALVEEEASSSSSQASHFCLSQVLGERKMKLHHIEEKG